MPVLANIFPRCPFPVNFDPYVGCGHHCAYCFANRRIRKTIRDKFDNDIRPGEPLKRLADFIDGSRSPRLAWCDWKIPVCIGRNTDPFQPAETEKKATLAALKLLAKKAYPFIITTKATLPATDPEYRAVLRDCNCVVQISMSCPEMDALERGAPPYAQRLRAVAELSRIVPRVICRWQPLFLEYGDNAIRRLKEQRDAGAYGILVETAHLKRPMGACRVFTANHYFYPVAMTEKVYTKIRAAAHARGLVFLAGNMPRMSDYVTCCIGGPLSGFRPSKCTDSFYWLAKDEFEITDAMKKRGTGEAFQNFWTGRRDFGEMKKHSFAELMLGHCRNPTTKLQITRG